jgi:hypothetical protein
MRGLVLLLALALVGCDDECTFSEATGLFEVFKAEGCFVSDANTSPADGVALSVFHGGNTVLVDGIDNLRLSFPGRQYVGRRGSCFLADEDAAQAATLEGHCDYFIRDFTKVSDTESRWTVELLDVYAAAYGNQGTFKGVLKAQSFDQGFGP